MPYPKPFARISWLFAVQGTDEIAETSCHVSTLGAAPFDAPAFVAGLVAADGLALAGYMTAMLDGGGGTQWNWADYSNFTAVKVADMTAAGIETAPPFIWNSPMPYDHGGGADINPQSTVVLSLRSGGTFGTANYGRMYIPHTSLQLASRSASAAPAATAACAALGRTFIGSINARVAAHTAGAGVVNLSKVGAGTIKGVAAVEVGSVVDTQRRRRNRIPEAYSTSVI